MLSKFLIKNNIHTERSFTYSRERCIKSIQRKSEIPVSGNYNKKEHPSQPNAFYSDCIIHAG